MTAERTAGPGQAGPNILIVDDSAMMRTMIKRVASVAGTPIGTIYEAANGREALAILEQHAVQFVFTDLNMPVMTGTELLRDDEGPRRVARHRPRHHLDRRIGFAPRSKPRTWRSRVYVEKPFRPEVMRDVLTSLTPARLTAWRRSAPRRCRWRRTASSPTPSRASRRGPPACCRPGRWPSRG